MPISALTILTYHTIDTSGSIVSVSPAAFAEQMGCLANMGFTGISLRQALNYRDAAHGGWPERAVVLTFDDGYGSVYEHAFPVLLRHGFGATVFLVTAHIGGCNDWAPPLSGLGVRRMLTWEQVASLSSQGIEIGAHTRSHPDLRRVSPRTLEEQLIGSRRDIEEHLSSKVESFAYPYGHASRSAVHVAGRTFRAACTTVLRRATDEPLPLLPRVDSYYIRSGRALARLLHGDLDLYLNIRRWGRALRRALDTGRGDRPRTGTHSE